MLKRYPPRVVAWGFSSLNAEGLPMVVTRITRAEWDAEVKAARQGLPDVETAGGDVARAGRPRPEPSKPAPKVAPPDPKKPKPSTGKGGRITGRRMSIADLMRFQAENNAAIVRAESQARISAWSEYLRSI